MTPDKKRILEEFLGKLPNQSAVRLAAAVETDKVGGGSLLPHDTLLDALRPALRKEQRPPRTPTPLRLVCDAFSDMLIDGPRARKQPGRIMRSSIVPMWTWVREQLMPARLAEQTQRISKSIQTRNMPAAMEVVGVLQQEVSEALRAGLAAYDPDTKEGRALAAKLGGPDVIGDLRDMALMLQVGPDLAPLRDMLPKRIDSLSEEQLTLIRATYDGFTEHHPEQAPYIALMVLGRLEKPWEGLKLLGAISRQSVDTLIANTDLGIVGEVLFSDMEDMAHAVRLVAGANFNPLEVVEKVAQFARHSAGMTREIGIRKDGKWGQRLLKARADIGEAMETLLSRAPREILNALPVHRVGGYGSRGPRRPDLSHRPDLEKVARAARFAELLSGVKPYAAQIAFNAAASDAFEEVANSLRLYNQEIVNEIRAAEPEDRVNAEDYVRIAMRISDLLLGEEESDQLRRRAAAAAR
ncbi:MAG: hypothetical protein GC199_07005 [Alphaproteobacteria bacterium]|nr:hypothetical protein [Alphaproteobacteria bacterium]